MRRLSLFLVALALAAVSPSGVSAQGDPVWTRGYSELGQSGCIEYVAAWSDSSFTSTPWLCPGPPARVANLTASRGYPQIAANGCTEYVSQWDDGQYSWVPYSCPPGVVYFKSQGRGMQQLTVTSGPTSPPADGIRHEGVPQSAPFLCPADYPIKAGLSLTREQIYHVPGGLLYGVTNPDRCFASEADAQANGYRRSP